MPLDEAGCPTNVQDITLFFHKWLPKVRLAYHTNYRGKLINRYLPVRPFRQLPATWITWGVHDGNKLEYEMLMQMKPADLSKKASPICRNIKDVLLRRTEAMRRGDHAERAALQEAIRLSIEEARVRADQDLLEDEDYSAPEDEPEPVATTSKAADKTARAEGRTTDRRRTSEQRTSDQRADRRRTIGHKADKTDGSSKRNPRK